MYTTRCVKFFIELYKYILRQYPEKRNKEMVLLLMIYCILLLSFFMGLYVWSLFCYEVHSDLFARYHTFVEIDHEIISTVILLPSADLFKKGCCQLQAKVCAQITG